MYNPTDNRHCAPRKNTDTLCKPAMPLYMMENTAAITSAMPPPHKVSHADIPLPPHAEVWTEDEDDEDDDEDDTPFNSGPGNVRVVHCRVVYMSSIAHTYHTITTPSYPHRVHSVCIQHPATCTPASSAPEHPPPRPLPP